MAIDIGVVADELAARTPHVHDVDLGARFRSVAELFRAGEPKVALEVLLSNVDEFDVPISLEEYAHVVEEAKALGLRPDEYDNVARLVVHEPGPGQGEPPNR